jgi:hypothetical protein
MTEFSAIAEVLEALAPRVEVEAERWDDVLARAQQLDAAAAADGRVGRLHSAVRALRRRSHERAASRRRRVLVLVGLLLLGFVLIVATAYALGYRLIDFSSAPPAAPRVVERFSSLSIGAPQGMDPRVNADETRLVGEIGGHKLWVAPTKAGGLCYEWSGRGGGCDAPGTVPLGVFGFQTGSWGGHGAPLSEPPIAFQAVGGFARWRWVDAVEIKLDDGSTIRPQLIWISPPIDAGFFYFDAPRGRIVASVLGLKNGEAVVGGQMPRIGARQEPHPYAELSKRQRLAAIETLEGTAALWSAPTKAGLLCTWLEFQGEEVEGLSCLPRGSEHEPGLGYAVYALGGERILAGTCGYSAAAFIHRDGSIRTVSCDDGIVFVKLTAADAAGRIAGVGEDGHVLDGSGGPVPSPTLRR